MLKVIEFLFPPFVIYFLAFPTWHSRKLDKSNPDHVSSNQNLISLNLFNLQVYAMHGLFSEIDLKAKREDWTRLQPRHQHWLCRFKIFAQPLPSMTFQSFNKGNEHSASSYAPIYWSQPHQGGCTTISYFSSCVKDSHRECVIERCLLNWNDKKKIHYWHWEYVFPKLGYPNIAVKSEMEKCFVCTHLPDVRLFWSIFVSG